MKNTISQLDLFGMYRTLHLILKNIQLFLCAHGTFTKVDHILGPKTSLPIFKRVEIQQNMFSDHKRLKVEFSNSDISGKLQIFGNEATYFK